MFRGDHPALRRAVDRAIGLARDLEHTRVGSEHLLLALATGDDRVAAVLRRHGATADAVRVAVRRAAPMGAGAAADRETLATIGVDVDRVLAVHGPALLDRPASREPLLPLGARAARRRCARMRPPLGLDAQAAYEASLRLALARREREHRPEHLAMALAAIDPGAAWVLRAAGARRERLVADLAATFPPPRRGPLRRVRQRLGRGARLRELIRRYERATGRTAVTTGTALLG